MPERVPEVVVISGKGGAGKTSLTAAFAHLAENVVICDLDVDAPDLHILLDPKSFHREDFVSGHEALIRAADCTGCGACLAHCRFGAVIGDGQIFRVDPLRCEGCRVCVALCPEGAVEFQARTCGEWALSETRFGPMVHARLHPGAENSGRLVTLLKREALDLASGRGADLILSDGAPGIGCPVISSLSGTDLAVVVTEPTPSGRHDLERVCELCEHFSVPVAVIINKADLNHAEADSIEAFCRHTGHEVLARLPHDPAVTLAMVERRAVTELSRNPLAEAVRTVWRKIETVVRSRGPAAIKESL
jgi:MinD superfamily P-loop ATPase